MTVFLVLMLGSVVVAGVTILIAVIRQQREQIKMLEKELLETDRANMLRALSDRERRVMQIIGLSKALDQTRLERDRAHRMLEMLIDECAPSVHRFLSASITGVDIERTLKLNVDQEQECTEEPSSSPAELSSGSESARSQVPSGPFRQPKPKFSEA